MNAERETAFAAWLINIGRFYGDGPSALVRESRDILSNYMDVPVLLGILEREEAYAAQRAVVDYAFELSLCESEKKEKLTHVRNLTSVFSRVTVTDSPVQNQKRYYPLAVESPEAVFPSDQADDGRLKELAKQFRDELLNLSHTLPESWESFMVTFDSLSRKYMWCITASDYEGEDISLYNQSRIASAIAACVVRSGVQIDAKDRTKTKDVKPFVLALCDFSGIQKYVFAVANVSESGVAKRLRARSFFVDITVSVISQVIIQRFGLTQNHILLLTGGKFYLLLPNTDEAGSLLKSIEQEMEENFYDMFKGQVAIHLAWMAMGEEGLENYSGSVMALSRQLSDKKSCAFRHILNGVDGWNEERFVLENDLSGKRICASCGCELTDNEHRHCAICRMQTQIGEKLPRTRYISYYKGRKEGTYPIYGDYSIGLWTDLRKDDAFLVEQLNGGSIPANAAGMPVRTRYMANHIPTDTNDDVMTFSDIADSAAGTARLAVLKADVDNLGYIFADGLRRKNRHFGTISRVNTMSRFLEIFFSGYIYRLITERPEYRNVYSVFSGGDDLFLIGAWDVMPKLAVEIAEAFRSFAAGNEALTISAAISIFQPKEHIANLADVSEQRLESIKDSSDSAVYPDKCGRDGAYFMGNKYSWADLKEQLAIGDRLAGLVTDGKLDSGILRRIATYGRMYRKFLAEGDVMSLMFEPLFHYDRQRNYGEMEKKKDRSTELQWFLDDYTPQLTKNAADSRIIKKNLYFAEAAVQYAMDKTKEERK